MIKSTQSGRQAHPAAEPHQANLPQTTIIAGRSILLGLAAALLALGIFGFLAFSVGRGAFGRLDDDALGGAYLLRSQASWRTPLMAAATMLGTIAGLFVQALAVAALLWWRTPAGWRSSLALLVFTL